MSRCLTDQFVKVIVDAPLGELDYRVDEDLCVAPGDRVAVPLGTRRMVGIVTRVTTHSVIEPHRIRKVIKVLADIPPLTSEWLALTQFVSRYYKRSWGSVATGALPLFFRRNPGLRHATGLAKLRQLCTKSVAPGPVKLLNDEQLRAVEAIGACTGFSVQMLFGVTGSGKTEVYLNAMGRKLAEHPDNQVLLLVPEINLTPQLESRVRERFCAQTVVTLHSSLTQTERARNWLAAHEGRARVLVGTRLATFASFRRLALIIVDEEHDGSYKAGDGSHFHARDVAIKRAQLCGIPCVLGSATPSMETWRNVLEGKYALHRLRHRAVEHASMPMIRLVDMRQLRGELFAPEVREQMDSALQAGKQVLVFINRRGYAPTLECPACGWVQRCRHCSGFSVYHKKEHRLVCHHCGTSYPIPDRCPVCGNADIQAVGRGTQKVEEEIQSLWPTKTQLRIDRDTVKGRTDAENAFSRVHAGEADIVIGTQMIAKGHDFQNIGVVVVLSADAQLVSPDLRAEEQLFALLLQVAGRAGRAGGNGVVLIQTRFPDHPIFTSLKAQDFEGFAKRILETRKEAGLPPYSYQALVSARSNSIERSLGFLDRIVVLWREHGPEGVRIFEPVPMSLMRLMDEERAQLLVESDSRNLLHGFLDTHLAEVKSEHEIDWTVEIDPAEV